MITVGVIGTMVWDTIWRHSGQRSPVEEWGGISYALAAADAIGPEELRVRPFIKLGRDLAERGLRFLRDLPVVETTETVVVIDQPNPRVELRYLANQRRTEQIRGYISSWTWPELAPRLRGCDALYVNFITGGELDLSCAKQVRLNFDGPIYADIHSLLLAIGPQGERSPQPLSGWPEWLSCFDAIQLNEEELRVLCSRWGDPWAFAAQVVGRETRLLLVTLGPNGAAYVMTADALPLRPRQERPVLSHAGPIRTGRVGATPVESGDPTGCGDVWGMTAFSALLRGHQVEEAIRLANQAGSRNVAHYGAAGLSQFLRGEIERG